MTTPIHAATVHSTIARHDESSTAKKFQRLIVLTYFVAATIALAALSITVHNAGPLPIDMLAAGAVQSIHTTWYDWLMRGVGEPGYPFQVYAWLAVMFVVLFRGGWKWETITEGFATIGIGVVGLVVKIFVDRPRPNPGLITVLNPALDGGKYSFPAGHVEVYMAIIGFLLFLSITLPHKYAWTRVIEIIGFSTLLALIGVSRVYTGEHWLTDVIGGYLLGSLWLILTLWLYDWGKARFFVKKKFAQGK